MCLECGFYKGRMVVDMKAKKEAREARLADKRSLREAQMGETAPEATPVAEAATEEKK